MGWVDKDTDLFNDLKSGRTLATHGHTQAKQTAAFKAHPRFATSAYLTTANSLVLTD